MAPPNKRPPQGRKPPQGKKPAPGNKSPQASKATAAKPQAAKPRASSAAKPAAGKPAAGGGGKTAEDAPAKSSARTATEAPSPAETSKAAEERKAKREAARLERVAIARQKEKAKRRKQILIAGVLVVGLVAVSLYGVQKSRGQQAAAKKAAEAAGCGPVMELENEGRNHIPLTETFDDYKTNPPTSGPHYLERVAIWGSYNEETPKTTLVHNLEHGGIVIHYKDMSPKQIDQIAEFVDSYSDGVISNPNPSIDKPIVLTSWTKMQKCDRFSEDAVAGYVQLYCNKGPEKLTTCDR